MTSMFFIQYTVHHKGYSIKNYQGGGGTPIHRYSVRGCMCVCLWGGGYAAGVSEKSGISSSCLSTKIIPESYNSAATFHPLLEQH